MYSILICTILFEFLNFVNSNKILNIKTAPYYPESNEEADEIGKVLKNFLKIKKLIHSSWRIKFKFLVTYRVNIYLIAENSPFYLVYQIRTFFDILKQCKALKFNRQEKHCKLVPLFDVEDIFCDITLGRKNVLVRLKKKLVNYIT